MLEPAIMSGDDLWRVRIAPGEEKVLTLEQVDDLFRLEMIDENTLLWQEGMSEWLPLRVVAGLDESEDAADAEEIRAAAPAALPVPPSGLAAPPSGLPPPPAGLSQPPSRLPPPPPAALPAPTKSQTPPAVAPPAPIRRDTLMPGWTAAPTPLKSEPPPPPSARRAATPPPPVAQSAPPPPTRSAPPPPPRPPTPSAAPPAFGSVHPPLGSAPPPLRSAPPALGSAPPPLRSAPPALGSAPPPLSNPPPPPLEGGLPVFPQATPTGFARPAPPARGTRMESMLIGVVALVGLLVTLHRNGVIHSVLASAGAQNVSQSLEAALGGPGFGTPAAVEALVKKTPPQK